MNNFDELKQQLATYLTRFFKNKADIVCEFPDAKAAHPQRLGIISVGIEKISAKSAGFDGYLGADDTSQQFGRSLEIVLRFLICCPSGRSTCHSLFTDLCAALLLEANCPFPVDSLLAQELRYDKAAGGFLLTATAEMRALLSTQETRQAISAFLIQHKQTTNEGE